MQTAHDDADCRIMPPRKQYVRLNESTRASIDTTASIGKGSFKEVYQGIYDSGPNEGERCVIKLMRDCRDNDALMERHFDIELSIVQEAQKHIDKFNDAGIIDRKIYLHKPEVWTFEADCDPAWAGKKCLCEPLLTSFVRFNSNTGWSMPSETDWPLVLQALSHFSYYKSGGDAVLCDLQGGAYDRDIALTDPIVMTRSQSYGATDLGKKGLEAFFSRHVCNKYCRDEWHCPKVRTTDIPIKVGSSMRNSQDELMHDALTPAGAGGIYVGPGLSTIKEDPEGSARSPAPMRPPPMRRPKWWLHKRPKTPMTPDSVTPQREILGKRKAAEDKDWAAACKRVTLQVQPGLKVPLQPVPMMNPAAQLQPCSKQ